MDVYANVAILLMYESYDMRHRIPQVDGSQRDPGKWGITTTKSSTTGCSCSSASAIKRMAKYRPMDFLGKKDDEPSMGENWLERTERMLWKMHCTPEENLECSTSLLQGQAYQWCFP